MLQLIDEEREIILDIYEEVFKHHSFTGRSGKFFGYEGLGSIYWHMNSKLLLAVQECHQQALAKGESPEITSALSSHYYQIRHGIGVTKSPDLYGAFPTDPYSHTPGHMGAQQPGMTGQVKEDILSRFGELGVFTPPGHQMSRLLFWVRGIELQELRAGGPAGGLGGRAGLDAGEPQQDPARPDRGLQQLVVAGDVAGLGLHHLAQRPRSIGCQRAGRVGPPFNPAADKERPHDRREQDTAHHNSSPRR